MDLIIPYIASDPHNGLELKYALRSICKYQPHDNLFIIGQRHPWYNGEFIPAKDLNGRPEYNVVQKVLKAIPYLSDDFILWQDDIFKLNDNPIKPCYCDTLEHALKRRSEGRFKKSLENTVRVYPDGLYYGGHTPMIINAEKFEAAMDIDWRYDYNYKSIYGNYAQIGGELLPDCKLPQAMKIEGLREWVNNRDYFSTGMMSMGKPLYEFWKELYPEKCKYESEG